MNDDIVSDGLAESRVLVATSSEAQEAAYRNTTLRPAVSHREPEGGRETSSVLVIAARSRDSGRYSAQP